MHRIICKQSAKITYILYKSFLEQKKNELTEPIKKFMINIESKDPDNSIRA